MSTRSRIGMEMPDGKIKSIYSHWDGYPSGVGAILEKHYKDPKKIEELLDLGDISSLGSFYDEELSALDFKKLDDPIKRDEIIKKTAECTVAYKDRGENCPARIDDNEGEFVSKLGGCSEEYGYLYMEDYDGVWRWVVYETPWRQRLTDLLKKEGVDLTNKNTEKDMGIKIIDQLSLDDQSKLETA